MMNSPQAPNVFEHQTVKPTFNITLPMHLMNRGIENLLIRIMTIKFGEYLLHGMDVNIKTTSSGDYYVQYRDDDKIIHEINISIYPGVITNMLADIINQVDVDNGTNYSQSFELDYDQVRFGVLQAKRVFNESITSDERISELKSLIENLTDKQIREIDFSETLPISKIYHELSHGFINRIYPLSLSKLQDRSDYNQADQEEYDRELRSKLKTIFKNQVLSKHVYSDSFVQNVASLNSRVSEIIFRENALNLNNTDLADMFFYFYKSGLQELWIRLLEARRNIIDEQIHYNLGRKKRFIKLYRNPLDILGVLHSGYIAYTILSPLKVLESLVSLDELSVEKIDHFIHFHLLPLMRRDVIEQRRAEIMGESNH